MNCYKAVVLNIRPLIADLAHHWEAETLWWSWVKLHIWPFLQNEPKTDFFPYLIFWEGEFVAMLNLLII